MDYALDNDQTILVDPIRSYTVNIYLRLNFSPPIASNFNQSF